MKRLIPIVKKIKLSKLKTRLYLSKIIIPPIVIAPTESIKKRIEETTVKNQNFVAC